MARRSRSSPTRSLSMTQTRSASTAAAPSRPMTPTTTAASPPAMASTPQQPGMFAQMASTAAGVAVGSTVGHMLGNGISSLFGSNEPASHEAQPQPQAQYQASNEQHGSTACGADALAYAKCLENNNYDPLACQVFKELLDQCKSFAHQRF